MERTTTQPRSQEPQGSQDLPSLLARVALRDRAAFEALYRATSSHLLGIAFRVLGQRERAEEVLQEAFMNIWNAAGSYSAAMATPMTWMINIVRNRAIDAARSSRIKRPAPSSSTMSSTPPPTRAGSRSICCRTASPSCASTAAWAR